MEYPEAPTYIAHTDGNSVDDTATFEDAGGNMLTVKNNEDGVVIDGTQYYSQTKVDQLLAEKDSELRAWATSQFQAKA